MFAVSAVWLAFGLMWLFGFYALARFRRHRLAAVAAAGWLAAMIWLEQKQCYTGHMHDFREVALSLYFRGHLVYGLFAFIGWNLGRKRRWRRKIKLYFRRCVAALSGRSRLRN